MIISKHLGAAEPWPPFCCHRELELVDREPTGSDGHSEPTGSDEPTSSV